MAGVIKQAGAATGVRAFGMPPPGALRAMVIADPRDDEAALLRGEVTRLAAELAQAHDNADVAAAEAKAEVRRVRDEALAEGRRAGLAAADTREGDRLAELRAGIADETARLGERLQALDGLAAALARACLDRLFAAPDAMVDMVAATLRRHVARLQDDAVLAVRVSGADFADADAVEAAVQDVRATVTIDPDLPAGACRIAARLGQVDLDVPAQWAALARTLDAVAA